MENLKEFSERLVDVLGVFLVDGKLLHLILIGEVGSSASRGKSHGA